MAKPEFATVDEYLAVQPEAVREALERVRSAIRKAVPEAEEVISYKMPAYKLAGSTVVYFAGWSQHYSLYPASGSTVERFKKELAPYKVSKGTIQFSLEEPVPVNLIERIAKVRAMEVSERHKGAGRSRKRSSSQASARRVPKA